MIDIYQMAQTLADLKKREAAIRVAEYQRAWEKLNKDRDQMVRDAERALLHLHCREIPSGTLKVAVKGRTVSLQVELRPQLVDPIKTIANISPDVWVDSDTGVHVRGWEVSHKRATRVTTLDALGAIVARALSEEL